MGWHGVELVAARRPARTRKRWLNWLPAQRACGMVGSTSLRPSWSTTTSIVTPVQTGGEVEKPSGAIAASVRLAISAWGTSFRKLAKNSILLTNEPPVRYVSATSLTFFIPRAQEAEPSNQNP